MKFHLHTDLTPEQVAQKLPNQFKPLLQQLDPKRKYATVIFRQNVSVVMSTQLQHALDKIPQDNLTVVVAQDFTAEARQLAQSNNNVSLVSARNFGWTDKSYYEIKHPSNYPRQDDQ